MDTEIVIWKRFRMKSLTLARVQSFQATCTECALVDHERPHGLQVCGAREEVLIQICIQSSGENSVVVNLRYTGEREQIAVTWILPRYNGNLSQLPLANWHLSATGTSIGGYSWPTIPIAKNIPICLMWFAWACFESVGHQLNVFCVFSHFWKQQKSLQSDLDSLTRPGSELWSLPPLGSRDEWWYWLVASVCGMQSTCVDRLTISNYNLSRTQGFSATVQGKTKGATNLWNPTATKGRFY